MSSKSRKNSQQGSSKSNQPRLSGNPKVAADQARALEQAREHARAGDPDEPTAEDFLEAEELLKTPKGRSPLVYGFLILLLIFLLIVFVAGDAFYGMGRNQGWGDTVMRWQHPSQGEVEVTLGEMREAGAKLGAAGFGPSPEDEDVAQYLILERLARDAGVRVGNAELVERLTEIRDSLGGIEIYRQRFRRFPGNLRGFEEFVRGQLAIGRYRAIVNEFASFPDVDGLIDAWAEQRQLYTFDHAWVAVDDFLEQAREVPPSEAELQAWFDGLSAFERREYEQQETRRVELVGAVFDDSERTYDALLAAYPDDSEEPVDEQARAQSYYDSSYFTRFRRETPIAEDDPGAPDDLQARIYLPFEEVEEQVKLEAAVKAALDRWRADLAARVEAGEEIDLAAEAERFGLERYAPEEPLTEPELRAAEGLGGLMISGPLFGMQETGQLTRGVTIGAGGLMVGRVLEIVPASSPEAADVREELLEPYAADRAAELAREAVAAVRATVMESAEPAPADDGEDDAEPTLVVSHEAFVAAAEAAGMTVGTTVDFDRTQPRSEDPSPVETFLRSQFALYSLEVGELDSVRESFDGERVYLVRLDAQRDPDPSELTAADFQRLLQNPPPSELADPFSIPALREHYGLWLANDPVEGEGEDEADPEGDTAS